MALNATTTGKAVADYINANTPTPGTPVTPAQLEALWEGIIGIIYTDLKTNAGVNAGFFIAPSGGGPVTGVGGPLI